MNKQHSHPLDYVLSCCEAGLAPQLFAVHNAKDELQKLRSQISTLQRYFDRPVAYAKINNLGDIYDLRLENNPYDDQSKVIPLYMINHG